MASLSRSSLPFVPYVYRGPDTLESPAEIAARIQAILAARRAQDRPQQPERK